MKETLENLLKDKEFSTRKNILDFVSIKYGEDIYDIQQDSGDDISDHWWFKGPTSLEIENGKFSQHRYTSHLLVRSLFEILYDNGFLAKKWTPYSTHVLYNNNDDERECYPLEYDGEIIFEFETPSKNSSIFVSIWGDLDHLWEGSEAKLDCVIGIIKDQS